MPHPHPMPHSLDLACPLLHRWGQTLQICSLTVTLRALKIAYCRAWTLVLSLNLSSTMLYWYHSFLLLVPKTSIQLRSFIPLVPFCLPHLRFYRPPTLVVLWLSHVRPPKMSQSWVSSKSVRSALQALVTDHWKSLHAVCSSFLQAFWRYFSPLPFLFLNWMIELFLLLQC